MGTPDLSTQPQINQGQAFELKDCLISIQAIRPSQLEPSYLSRKTMSELNKIEAMHTERVSEAVAEDQEAHPKVALSTALAVFVSRRKQSAVRSR